MHAGRGNGSEVVDPRQLVGEGDVREEDGGTVGGAVVADVDGEAAHIGPGPRERQAVPTASPNDQRESKRTAEATAESLLAREPSEEKDAARPASWNSTSCCRC